MAEAAAGKPTVRQWPFMSRWARELEETGRRHVPTKVMLDYAYGGFDDELLDALYGEHIRGCASCAGAVKVYRRQRPSDSALLNEVPEFADYAPIEKTYQLTPGEAGTHLRNFIAAESGPLLIVAGEANPAVYNPALGDTLRARSQAARRTGESLPKVICGPAMGLDSQIKDPADTVFPILADEGYIQLYVARHRQRLHFRVSGEESVYTEEYHKAGNPGNRHGYWYRSRPIAGLFRRRFEALLEANLAHPAKREDFVYLRMDAIRRIEEEESLDFDSMTAERLKEYVTKSAKQSAAACPS